MRAMANLSASKKNIRVSLRRKARNYITRHSLRDVSREFLTLVKSGDKTAASALLPRAFSAIDKAVKKDVIHRNNGARKKSKLSRALAGLK